MSLPKKLIRVMVVDDSVFARRMLIDILKSDPGISVIGEASNGQEALDQVAVLKPDLITLDFDMPVLGGLEAIERILARFPVPILVIAEPTATPTATQVLSRGARGLSALPDANATSRREFLDKVHLLASVGVGAPPPPAGATATAVEGGGRAVSPAERVVAIAASTGGPQALQCILSRLPARFPAPIVVAQHISDGFTGGLADWLGRSSPLRIKMAVHGETLQPGTVLINPSEHAMTVDARGVVSLGDRDARLVYRPSCNTLLLSVAAAYRERAVGLILTGMGSDGVTGMMAIRQAGGITLAQDDESSVVFGMNRVAVDAGCIQRVLPLDSMSGELRRLMGLE
jgi:two-component system, chemotaxis family, protein-glutamate methylesterase/glutaminase